MHGKWELFHVRYRMPLFGSEGKEFRPEVMEMMVSTQGGRDDAKAACIKYHPGCKVVNVCSHIEELAGVNVSLAPKKVSSTKSKKKK